MADPDHPTTLTIGLLQCGHLHEDLAPVHGDYPEIFADLLGPHGIELRTWDVTQVPPPERTDECDGWLVSGSADSTYDDLPWIAAVEAFLRQIVADRAPLVAVCFGHQLLAQALGGRVAKADAGWGVGAHDYVFSDPPPAWMDPPPSGPIRIVASHQDQVLELPPEAHVIASTNHCPVAAYTLGDTSLAIQPHPEFTAEISRGLVTRRRDRIGPDRADDALASLAEPLDNQAVGAWMAQFLRQAHRLRAAGPG